MRISIGSDHRGVELRNALINRLKDDGYDVKDCGTQSTDACDYPDIAELVGNDVSEARSDRGILICGTGIGMSIAANKINSIRAVVCRSHHDAEMSRKHNNANVLCLSTDQASDDYELVRLWLSTDFEGGRHQRRVEKIAELESSKSVM